MQWRQNLTNKWRHTWYNLSQHKVFVGILIGLSLIVGIGLGVYRSWPVEEPVSNMNLISREELESALETRVQEVIADFYPWVLDGPIQLVTVEPPANPQPNPDEKRPRSDPQLSFEHLIWPVQGEIATPFGWYRHPVYGDWRFNAGLEFNATGDVIRTVLPGEVAAIHSNGLETELVINHGSGWKSTYRSVRGITVGPGDQVEQNQNIAFPESTGLVFFGLTHNDEPVNPQAFLR